jgi:hypothetical protein
MGRPMITNNSNGDGQRRRVDLADNGDDEVGRGAPGRRGQDLAGGWEGTFGRWVRVLGFRRSDLGLGVQVEGFRGMACRPGPRRR